MSVQMTLALEEKSDDKIALEWIPDHTHVLCGGIMTQTKIDKACSIFRIAMEIHPQGGGI